MGFIPLHPKLIPLLGHSLSLLLSLLQPLYEIKECGPCKSRKALSLSLIPELAERKI
jgi:hypothetical protein